MSNPISQRFSSPRFFGLLGIIALVVGAVVPFQHDETYWVAIARMVDADRVLYEDALDAKTPLIYAVARLIDFLPGSLVLGRSIVVAGLLTAFAATCLWLGNALGMHRASAIAAITWCTGLLALVSGFAFTTELPAAVLVAAALGFSVKGRSGLTIGSTLGACAFDPRSALLAVALVIVARTFHGNDVARRIAVGIGVGLLAGGTVVIAMPAMRFAILELSIASRNLLGGFEVTRLILTALIVLLPCGALLVLSRIKVARSDSQALLVSGLLVAVLSLAPILHYWSLLVPGLFYSIAASGRGESSKGSSTFHYLALVPLIAFVATGTIANRAVAIEYQEAARILRSRLAPGEGYVAFVFTPYLALEMGEAHLLRAPEANHLRWPSSRQGQFLSELPYLVDRASSIVDDGGLSVSRSQVTPSARPLWDFFKSRQPYFPCTIRLTEVTLRFREAC